VAVWQEQDVIVADEFRDGNVAGGEDPLSSVQRAFAALPEGIQERYFRGDTADDDTPLLKWLVQQGISFAIGADMGKELRGRCEAVAAEAWHRLEQRDTEDVPLAEVEFVPGDWPKTAAPLRYVAVRFTPRQQQMCEARGPKYLAVASHRGEPSAAELVRWYWQKAGTVEHTHRCSRTSWRPGCCRADGSPPTRRGSGSTSSPTIPDAAAPPRAAGGLHGCPTEAPALRGVHAAGPADGSSTGTGRERAGKPGPDP
jgi:hypothetical protein